ncbi:MAG TPA: hypothetical protein VIM81_12740 [Gammaproteobacteria bacterium]
MGSHVGVEFGLCAAARRAARCGLLALIAGTSPAFSQPPQLLPQPPAFAPADFAMPNELVKITLDRRDVAPENHQVLIRCQAFVGTEGNVDDVSCMSSAPGEHVKYVAAVLDTVPDQSFTPARVVGEPVRVYMSFAVFFICANQACQAIPVRNHGEYVEEYGIAYFAPQPILPEDMWYAGFEQKLAWTRAGMPTMGEINRLRQARGSPSRGAGVSTLPLGASLSAEVAADGTVSGVESIPLGDADGPAGFGPRAPGGADPLEGFGAVEFIPGFRGAEAVPMRIVEQTVTYDF